MAKALRRAHNTAPLLTPTEPTIAGPREHVGSSSTGDYVPQWAPLRPGAEDALKLPSRSGKRLNYRDGREERLA